MDLTEFLTARLDEDEAAARGAPGDNWQAFTEDDIAGASVYDEQWILLYPERYDHDKPLSARPGATGPQYIQRSRDELAAHIARHDPARVLREVAAKQAIVEKATETWHWYQGELSEDGGDKYGDGTLNDVRERWDTWEIALKMLAAVYSNHPDYRAEWKP